MNLTKFEQRILGPKFLSQSKVLFWIGVICIVISFSAFFLESIVVNKARSSFVNVSNQVSNITPNTDNEIALKDMVVGLIAEAEKGWVANAKTKTQHMFIYFFFIGIVFISTSSLFKKIHLFGQKLKTPNHVINQTENTSV